MKKIVKMIRIIVFSAILMMLMCEVGDVLAKYGDAIKVRNILYYCLPLLLIAYLVLIVMFDFIEQDDLYYCLGSMYVLYHLAGTSGSCTAEDTIKKDIAYTHQDYYACFEEQ